jgi:uncharacterized YccA/Bax inhibitor family protein
MKSNNPVFNRAEGFNGQVSTNAYGNTTYPGSGAAYPGYGQQTYADPSTWGTGTPETHTPMGVGTGRMTIDSVVQKSGLALGMVIVAAAVTWLVTPDLDAVDPSPLIAAVTIGSLVAFALSLVNSFKRVVSPGLVLAFCAAEGVALGGFSKIFETAYPGVVVQAVLGTFAAFGGTLAAYKFLNIQVGNKFRTFVMSAMWGMIALSLLEVVLAAFGGGIGLFGNGGIGIVFAAAGLALGVFMLIMDFDFVEQGVAAGLPEQESWRAAFALTVSLVWIYTNLLRLLAIFSDN